MLSLLDEESRFPKGTDQTLLEKLHKAHEVCIIIKGILITSRVIKGILIPIEGIHKAYGTSAQPSALTVYHHDIDGKEIKGDMNFNCDNTIAFSF